MKPIPLKRLKSGGYQNKHSNYIFNATKDEGTMKWIATIQKKLPNDTTEVLFKCAGWSKRNVAKQMSNFMLKLEPLSVIELTENLHKISSGLYVYEDKVMGNNVEFNVSSIDGDEKSFEWVMKINGKQHATDGYHGLRLKTCIGIFHQQLANFHKITNDSIRNFNI